MVLRGAPLSRDFGVSPSGPHLVPRQEVCFDQWALNAPEEATMDRSWSFVVAAVTLAVMCPTAEAKAPSADAILSKAIGPAEVNARLDRYVETPLGVGQRDIPKDLSAMLGHLKRAADHIDKIYWKQSSPRGLQMVETLRASPSQAAQSLARLLSIHYGPWDRHDDDSPFIGRSSRPSGVSFYPADASRREIDQWTQDNLSEAPAVWSPYTVVKRQGANLVGVPYSRAYKEDLKAAAEALRDAAAAYTCEGPACQCAGLKSFLEARAKSLLDDDYRTSERQWFETKTCPLDIAIGPYEFYTDRLLGLKTAYEAIIYKRDEGESQRYARLLGQHEGLLKNLPMSESVRARFSLARPSPITIGDVLYTSGDARAGYQVRAFILPNDEVVREEKGTKNVVLRNVVRAKFDTLVKPIAKQIFDAKSARKVSFNAYYDFLLAWQMAHAVVPGDVTLPSGVRLTARHQLRGRAPLIDAVKGEVIALLNYLYLLEQGVLRASGASGVTATYLASLFDTVRLSEGSPQSTAKAIVYNYLARGWVFRYNPKDQRFEVNPPALKAAVTELAAEVLQILGRGDYDGAGQLIVRFGIIPAEVRQKLNELKSMPVEILPKYTSVPKG